MPDVVRKGAQTNFQKFSESIKKNYEDKANEYNEKMNLQGHLQAHLQKYQFFLEVKETNDTFAKKKFSQYESTEIYSNSRHPALKQLSNQ